MRPTLLDGSDMKKPWRTNFFGSAFRMAAFGVLALRRGAPFAARAADFFAAAFIRTLATSFLGRRGFVLAFARFFFAAMLPFPKLRSDAELLFQDFVDQGRVGLAARALHHLADEPAHQ